MKNEKRYRSEQFSITTVFYSVLAILFLILLTLAGVFDTTFDKLDKFTDSLIVQAWITIITILLVCYPFAKKFISEKFKEWRN